MMGRIWGKGCAGLCLLLLLISIYSPPSFASKSHKRTTAYIHSSLWTDRLLRGIQRGQIAYVLLVDKSDSNVDLSYDFEVALYVWLKLLGFADATVKKCASPAKADIVVHLGNRRLNGRPMGDNSALYDTYAPRGRKKPIPLIEINGTVDLKKNHHRIISIPEARQEEVTGMTKRGSSTYLHAATDFFGDVSTPQETADYLIQNKPKLNYGRVLYVLEERVDNVAGILAHELGHAFGLEDLSNYARNGSKFKIPHYPSIMRQQKFEPLVPTSIDIRRARRHLWRLAQCPEKIR